MTFQIKKHHQRYTAYQDTGIPWLGEVPEGWSVAPLKWFISIGSGEFLANEKFNAEGELQVIGGNGEMGKTDYFNSIKDTIVIGRVGAKCGNIHIARGKSWITDNALRVKSLRKFDLQYLTEFLRTRNLNNLANKNAQPLISGTMVKNTFVAIPSIKEQQKIANYLDEKTELIDQVVTAKKRQIELLKEKRSSLINRAVTRGIEEDVEMKDSGVEWIGEVPKGWEVSKLKYFSGKIVDGTHFTPTYTETGVPFLRVTDIQTSEIDLTNVKYVSEQEHKQLCARCKPQKGDILLSKNGTIGIPKVVDWEWDFSIFVSLCLIKINRNKVNPHYAKYFFESHSLKNQMSQGGQTTSVTNLHLEKIKEFWFAMPDLERQQKIVNYLDTETAKIDQTIALVEQSIALLEEYKTSLIATVVTGKVKVFNQSEK